jgi:hypothetical protein
MAKRYTGLLERTIGDTDLFLARDIFDEISNIRKSAGILAKDNFQIYVDVQFRLYFNNDFMKLIDYNMTVNNLSDRKAALCAHGGFSRNNWIYFNNDTPHNVQSWINKYDGQYKVLLISSCNSGNATVYSNKSALLLPNTDFNVKDIEGGLAQVELYIPRIGYIDSYCIDEYVANPKKMFSK